MHRNIPSSTTLDSTRLDSDWIVSYKLSALNSAYEDRVQIGRVEELSNSAVVAWFWRRRRRRFSLLGGGWARQSRWNSWLCIRRSRRKILVGVVPLRRLRENRLQRASERDSGGDNPFFGIHNCSFHWMKLFWDAHFPRSDFDEFYISYVQI